jgi:hypothetical protein
MTTNANNEAVVTLQRRVHGTVAVTAKKKVTGANVTDEGIDLL